MEHHIILVSVLVALLIISLSNLSVKTKLWLILWITIFSSIMGAVLDSLSHGAGVMNYLIFGALMNGLGNITSSFIGVLV
jgi:hypothetical protein